MEQSKNNRFKMKEILKNNILPFVLIHLIDEYLKESFLLTVGGYSTGIDSTLTCPIFNNENKQWEYFSTFPKEMWEPFLFK